MLFFRVCFINKTMYPNIPLQETNSIVMPEEIGKAFDGNITDFCNITFTKMDQSAGQ